MHSTQTHLILQIVALRDAEAASLPVKINGGEVCKNWGTGIKSENMKGGRGPSHHEGLEDRIYVQKSTIQEQFGC